MEPHFLIFEQRWETYRKQLRRCQRHCSEAAVHELRVVSRRLLAQFALLSCVVSTPVLEKARRVLKRRLTALSDLRDTHVQRMFIDQQAARFPELLLLRSALKRRERRLVKSAAGKVSHWKMRKLERWISAIIKDLVASGRGSRAESKRTATVLRATTAAFAEAVKRRRAINLDDLRTVHQTRVAFKLFRYMVEALSPALTGLSKRQLRALAYYQRRMGIIQDLEVIQACVVRYLRENPEQEALLRPFYRYLQQRRRRALQSFVEGADRLYNFWPPLNFRFRGMPLSPQTRRNA